MSALKRKSEALFVLFFCVLLAVRMFIYASPAHEKVLLTAYLWPAVIAATALLFATRSYKGMPKAAHASLLLSIWFLVVTALNGDKYLEYNLHFIYGIFFTFGLGFPLIILLPNKEKWLSRISLFYAAIIFVVALLCLYCWITGGKIVSPFSKNDISIRGWRMFFFDVYPNELGCAFGIGFFGILMLAFRCKRSLTKALCTLVGAVIYLAAIPCASRTTAIVISFALACALLLLLIKRLPIPQRVIRAVVAAALSAAIALLSVNVLLGGVIDLKKIYDDFNKPPAKTQTAAQPTDTQDIAPTEAEVIADKGESVPHDISGDIPEDWENELPPSDKLWARDMTTQVEGFTGRTAIWLEAINYIKERPITLLIGNTDGYVARIPTRLEGYGAIHMQNMWIEMLMQTGVLGLALYACIMLSALWAAIKRFLSPVEETWKRYLCLIVPVTMLTGLMEIYPGVSGNIMDMVSMMLIGAVIALDARDKAARNNAKE